MSKLFFTVCFPDDRQGFSPLGIQTFRAVPTLNVYIYILENTWGGGRNVKGKGKIGIIKRKQDEILDKRYFIYSSNNVKEVIEKRDIIL